MINYVAHWDRILIQSRSQIVNELSDYKFRSICPVANENELKNHYAESLNWKIAREKYFDFFAVLSLRKILKNIEDGSIFHIFTLKTGFLFMISNLFLNKNFKSTLSITGLGYAICSAELILGPVVPSNTARGGGILAPIVDSISRTLGSSPNNNPQKAGQYLNLVGAHANLITAAMFLTGMAANPLVSRAALEVFEIEFGFSLFIDCI